MERTVLEQGLLHYFPKVCKIGGKSNVSYCLIIPKPLVQKYMLHREERLLLEENEEEKVLTIRKIGYD